MLQIQKGYYSGYMQLVVDIDIRIIFQLNSAFTYCHFCLFALNLFLQMRSCRGIGSCTRYCFGLDLNFWSWSWSALIAHILTETDSLGHRHAAGAALLEGRLVQQVLTKFVFEGVNDLKIQIIFVR